MKGIIRIGSIDFKGHVYLYWSLFVLRGIARVIKKLVGSSGIFSFTIFYNLEGVGRARQRVDYFIISCPLPTWQKLKEELKGRYLCMESPLKLNKRKQSLSRTDVDLWDEVELEDVSVFMKSSQGDLGSVIFDINSGQSFYKPYKSFIVDKWKDKYEKNLWAGTLILKAERRWFEEGGSKKWKKRKAWKLENGNFQKIREL